MGKYNFMKELIEEFTHIAMDLDTIASESRFDAIANPLDLLDRTTEQVGKAWCGSYLGYHSRVYYEDLQAPPAGANFSSEWGLYGRFARDSRGSWKEYGYDDVRAAIFEAAGNPDLAPAKELAQKARELFEAKKVEVNSLLITLLENKSDSFLERKGSEVEAGKIFYAKDFILSRFPKGQFSTRDSLAASQGLSTPPHLSVEAEIVGFRSAFQACDTLSKLVKQITNHLLRKERIKGVAPMVKKQVFIGHGRSLIWRELKDFLQDRLNLSWDEFNRVPVAGIANTARLSQILDDAGIGFLVLTAEDESFDGKMQARMNVIHEAGLFQGRLGFTKAIILLEEGCEEFSNIQGLGQIRFPKGQIKTAFEEVREVLEREGVL